MLVNHFQCWRCLTISCCLTKDSMKMYFNKSSTSIELFSTIIFIDVVAQHVAPKSTAQRPSTWLEQQKHPHVMCLSHNVKVGCHRGWVATKLRIGIWMDHRTCECTLENYGNCETCKISHRFLSTRIWYVSRSYKKCTVDYKFLWFSI